ncbi:hypothetical protein KU75_14385 [Pectobacterium odoriferum]|uniref:Uncharacterized protein n=1 Tax=Pectobacterium odoriferum TaxID=78398 RepID=A0ABR4VNC1_9GAMM|nr:MULTISPECIES: hypothetical protein [Pectobacterium]KGA40870.1 hypothetical protein KU75_14385 [Pectobacterium odoriferum]UEM38570.1 hypothetical protein DMB82_0015615 [Pectobacterium aquaticum]
MSSYITKIGPMDGNLWEEICQLVFKKLYRQFGYQEMPASPGDYGIEGFVKDYGIAIQCYCPEKVYTQEELYEKQRDKITRDLAKLNTYKDELKKRLGDCKIKKWIFLCPEINRNEILSHIVKKQEEIRALSLDFLSDDFEVDVQDIDFYIHEIQEIMTLKGSKITFDITPQQLDYFDSATEEMELNIQRKNEKRCVIDGSLNSEKHKKLNVLTEKKFLAGDVLLRRIEKDSALIYFELARVINQYENEIEELCITWDALPEQLIERIKGVLALRIKESIPMLGDPERHSLVDSLVAKWIALCPLELN